MSDHYDVIVIGAGPAGYSCAIRAAQLGLSTACVDKWQDGEGKSSLGGTCLNAGCIPSKALLESSELFELAGSEFASHGIQVGQLSLDLATMQKRKAGIVSELTGGIGGLFKANGVAWLAGEAEVQGTGRVHFEPSNGEATDLTADNIVIAAGSEPTKLDIAPLDGDRVLDSRGALEMTEVPDRLGVIGAGYIGVELGSVWSRLGADVTLLEALDDFMPIADRGVANEGLKQFKSQGLDIQLGARVTSVDVGSSEVEVTYQSGNETKSQTFDRIVIAVGRRPHTANLLADSAQITLDDRGFIDVSDDFRTSLPGVYAVGDVIGSPMLAHKGMEEGVAAAEQLTGQLPHVSYRTIPSVVYTEPEMAWVGDSEADLKAGGIAYRSGQIPFAANGRAKALGNQAGFVKILAHAETDEVLGAHMIGPNVSELVQEIVVAMEYRAASEDIARIVHGHPTLGETVHEAALAVDDRPIHFPPPKKRG
ncbi:dihydrolipoyl dehydrogenase [Salinisphaera sp. USBA-960]|uniref:dihydrolipoyl dehydrogenase n=1 Tax=Salinisphaera orenii TaxID=856731 RepID=UPI000DBE8437|nr:dihydrolipoyl dehydrogenase [Salifodinibacter halophilus]NNC26048.1 dihydrolipoyl dehydrogenase [Salifodinibacter halophilus]